MPIRVQISSELTATVCRFSCVCGFDAGYALLANRGEGLNLGGKRRLGAETLKFDFDL